MRTELENHSAPSSDILGVVALALTNLTKTLIAHGAGGGDWSEDTIQELRNECIYELKTTQQAGLELSHEAAITNSALKMLEIILDEAVRQATENKYGAPTPHLP